MARLFASLTLLSLAALCAGCAKEDPEARLPGAYDRSLEKAEQVEQTLQDSVSERMQPVDKGN